MAYIFMDESGDLGFAKPEKNSKYFIVTFLFAPNKKPIDKAVKKIFNGLKKNNIKISNGVLHSSKEKPTTRIKLLKLCAEISDISVMTIYLNKSKVFTKLQDEKHILYNYVVNILIDRILNKKLIPTNQKINFIASRRETSKLLNDNFIGYLENKTKEYLADIHFFIQPPHQEKGLQMVDFLSWAIYQKYERSDFSYYEHIKSIIVEEKGLFV